MTPLAYAMAKQLALKPRKRKPFFFGRREATGDELAAFVHDIHCFEVTEVLDIACDLVDKGQVEKLSHDLIFLPAPKTWIEHKFESGRHAWMITENPFRYHIVADRGDIFGAKEFDLRGPEERSTTGLVLAMLALINAPHIVSRENFEPHRELVRLWQRRDRHAPLHAWHELKLHIAKPADIDDDEPHASHIGGRRALHFCRSHLRIRQGRLEFVTSHWRGDPALGTKQARYRVVA